ncbi:hypothetical protein JT26_07180 [Porphyromonas sp. COT-108 OH1349]|uniref:Uncharacterized protein n=2 Tax=Porphyromonadaceae TaxID=171551 RepID=A0ABR4XJD8_9PORP|nr:hypothetical protein JT26_07180 [Porphyromonas sp. COT-108 OH1349]KGN91810.1 hypothetical protein HQ43_06935 [Porphyromonas canoris]
MPPTINGKHSHRGLNLESSPIFRIFILYTYERKMNILKKLLGTLLVIGLFVLVFTIAKGIIVISSALLKFALMIILGIFAISILIGLWRSGTKKNQ